MDVKNSQKVLQASFAQREKQRRVADRSNRETLQSPYTSIM